MSVRGPLYFGAVGDGVYRMLQDDATELKCRVHFQPHHEAALRIETGLLMRMPQLAIGID